jgi:hypothetical protein
MLHIPHYDCVELYCRIVAKVEGHVSLNVFKEHDTLKTAIDNSEDGAYINALNDAIKSELNRIKKEALENKRIVKHSSIRENLIYELGRSARTKYPFMISNKDLQALLLYLGNADYKPYSIDTGASTGVPLRRESMFADTKWVLYHRDEQDSDKIGKVKTQPSILKATLQFDLFNRVTILSPSTKLPKPEKYIGRYEIYNDQFLLMQLVTKATNSKRLRIEIMIGRNDNEGDLLVGQFHNLDDSIYSGTLLLEREPENVCTVPILVPFSKKGDTDEIPDYVWKYFRNKRMNQLRSPKQVYHSARLITWMIAKEQALQEQVEPDLG